MSEHHRYSEDYTAGAPKTDIKAARALSHSNMIDHLNETDEGVRANENVNQQKYAWTSNHMPINESFKMSNVPTGKGS